MSDIPPQDPSAKPSSTPTAAMSPEDLAGLLASSGMMPTPGSGASDSTGKGSLRRKLLIAVVIAAIGVGASIMSCVGQSFSYRQARAMEGIEQQLKEIRASCPASTLQPPREEAR